VTQQARDVLSHIDSLVSANDTVLRSSLRNIETVTSTLADNSQRLDKVMAGLQNLIGGNDGNGQIGQAAESIRKLTDDLDKNTNQIAIGLNQFSNGGLKEFEALAVDGRHTLAELNKAIKNINEHPSQLLFGH
jgi:phospholipid/cholesterol/gamma-HCH transport system substrate-binding protein